MSNGKLGGGLTTTNTATTFYTVPTTASYATVSINLVNTSSTSDATIKIAVGTSVTPGLADFIEYGVVLPKSGIYERECLVLSVGEMIVIEGSNNEVAVRIHGLEKPA